MISDIDEQCSVRWQQAAIAEISIRQHHCELSWLCARIAELSPATILEIGTRKGGWLYAVAPFCLDGARFYAVDSVNDRDRVRTKRALVDEGYRVSWIMGNSKAPKTVCCVTTALGSQELHLLHIDGGHDTATAMSDYDNYGALVCDGGMIVFHDSHNRRFGVGAAITRILSSDRLRNIERVEAVYDRGESALKIPTGITVIYKRGKP